MPWFGVRKGVLRLLPGLTRVTDPVLERTLARLPLKVKIVDLGAGGRRITQNTVTVDAFTSTDTDIVADVHILPLRDSTFEAVFCTGTLEHVEYPPRVLREIRRILRPGGYVHIEVPFLQPFHADPSDYWRWTLPGIELLCTREGFERIESGTHIGPASAMAWVLNEWALSWVGNGRLGTIVSAIIRLAAWPFLASDKGLVRLGRAQRAASGLFFIGRKEDLS